MKYLISLNNSSRNVGEEAEVFLKAFLVQQAALKKEVEPFGFIESLNFGPEVSVPDWLLEHDQMLGSLDYPSLKRIFAKAGGSSKADVGINGINYSLKYTGGAKSAIVNHTTRRGFLRVCDLTGLPIEPLDRMIDEYWAKREANAIKEDVPNINNESPFKNHKEYFKPIIKYFLFDGTGSRDSSFKADKLLKFSNPTDPATYSFLSKDAAVDYLWESLVFSLRSKGMPDPYNEELHGDLTPWVRLRDGVLKGALHIRN